MKQMLLINLYKDMKRESSENSEDENETAEDVFERNSQA